MIIFDTETTGLVKPKAIPLDQQPKIIEFAAVKLDDDSLDEVDSLEFLVNPKQPLSNTIINITNITDHMLTEAKPFSFYYQQLVDFFLGERVLVAHNVAFDRDLLTFELERIGRLNLFPWPPTHKCTVELSMSLKGYRLKLGQLYELAFGKAFKDQHRAMADTRALVEVVHWLRTEKGLL